MDYLGEKLNTVTGSALGSINEMKRKRQKQSGSQQEQQQQLPAEGASGGELDAASRPPHGRHIEWATQVSTQQPLISQPFGYETQQPPPPIGFHLGVATSNEAAGSLEKQPSGLNKGASDESLYQGDTWARLWFQRLLIIGLVRLIVFIRKVYEDYKATQHYSSRNDATGPFLASVAALFLPTLVFTTYRVARYLQVALAEKKHHKGNNDRSKLDGPESESRALMSPDTPQPSSPPPPHLPATAAAVDAGKSATGHLQEEDGLVTARQTPTPLAQSEAAETFHEASTEVVVVSPSSPQPSEVVKEATTTEEEEVVRRERVNVERLGVVDREGARLIIGTGEQLLHGLLFIFWQLKRQVDLVGYLVERACLYRKPSDVEKRELGRLGTSSDGLEWFQDFYAAFLAILAQVYTLGIHWTANTNSTASSPTTKSPQDKDDLLIVSEIVVSMAVVFSLLIAVRRRDDGPLTLGLSILGWGGIFASRIIVISLAFVHIGWRIMLPLVLGHIGAIAVWIYKIALDSHNEKPGESEEAKWTTNSGHQELELGEGERADEQKTNKSTQATSDWTPMEHLALVAQILILFALPSLFYWPIMFNLKLHCRPFKYLVLVLTENFLLIPAIWFSIQAATTGQWILLSAAAAASILGFLFLFLYVTCKPSLTEYFARADELFNEAERAGIYFEFCSRVFKLPDLSKQAFKRLLDQREEEIET